MELKKKILEKLIQKTHSKESYAFNSYKKFY